MSDEKTAEEALAQIVLVIMGLPDDANAVNVTIGKRSESVGGGWYWGVTHVVAFGPAHQPPYQPLDRSKCIAEATTEMLKAIDACT